MNNASSYKNEIKGLPWFKIVCLSLLLYMAVQILLAVPPVFLLCLGAVTVWQYLAKYCPSVAANPIMTHI